MQEIVSGPEIGRVVAVFTLVAALAVVAGLALRRVLPRFTGVQLAGSALRVVERANLGPGTRVHLLQIEGEKVLVAESRSGLAITVLGKSGTTGQP
jgi:flagellar biogenesis protein FliO